VDLPNFPDVSDDVLCAIAARYGGPVVRLPEVGIFNAVFSLLDDSGDPWRGVGPPIG